MNESQIFVNKNFRQLNFSTLNFYTKFLRYRKKFSHRYMYHLPNYLLYQKMSGFRPKGHSLEHGDAVLQGSRGTAIAMAVFSGGRIGTGTEHGAQGRSKRGRHRSDGGSGLSEVRGDRAGLELLDVVGHQLSTRGQHTLP